METGIGLLKATSELNNIGAVSILLFVSITLGYAVYKVMLVEHRKILDYMEVMTRQLEAQTQAFEKTTQLQETLCNKFYELNREHKEVLCKRFDNLTMKVDQMLGCSLDSKKDR